MKNIGNKEFSVLDFPSQISDEVIVSVTSPSSESTRLKKERKLMTNLWVVHMS
jgi:hypothetical protein